MTGWALYELCKRAWIQTHPHATPAEYDAAMMALARSLGL
jgi:hypothetical protein